MKIARLHYITQGNSAAEIFKETENFINAGGNWLQLRIKSDELDVLAIGKKVKALCANKAVFIVNDRVDVANRLDADGVHLGLTDMPIPQARRIMGEAKIIGGTANTYTDCQNRQKDGADYIGLGPFKSTLTKKKLSPLLGIDGYTAILQKEDINLPVLAIGGIQLTDIPDLMGIRGKSNNVLLHGVAVSGLIHKAADTQKIVEELNQKLNNN